MNPLLIRWGRTLAAGLATWALAGCAALQIDVDVYKGPLANDDETQSQQLASVALTAKPLISTMRNRLITESIRSPVLTAQERAGHIGRVTWERLVKGQDTTEQKRRDLQRAAQLNSILSFYEDREGQDLYESVERIFDLLAQVKRSAAEAAKPSGDKSAAKGTSTLVLTELREVVSAQRTAVQASQPKMASIESSTRARQQKSAQQQELTATIAQLEKEVDKLLATPPDDPNKVTELERLADKVRAQVNTYSSDDLGFGRGRPYQGIEAMADEVAQVMFERRSVSGRSISSRSRDAAVEKSQRVLAQLLVDLAARMQFLAKSLWLIDSSDTASAVSAEQVNTFKALLETVANTIMVQADEQRVKNAYKERQVKGKDFELAGVAAATSKRTRAQEMDSVLSQIEGMREQMAGLEADAQSIAARLSATTADLAAQTATLAQLGSLAQGTVRLAAYFATPGDGLAPAVAQLPEANLPAFRAAANAIGRPLRSTPSTATATFSAMVAGLRDKLSAQSSAPGMPGTITASLASAIEALDRLTLPADAGRTLTATAVLARLDESLRRQYQAEAQGAAAQQNTVASRRQELQQLGQKQAEIDRALGAVVASSPPATALSVTAVLEALAAQRDAILAADEAGAKSVLDELRQVFKTNTVVLSALAKVNIKAGRPLPSLKGLETSTDVMDALIAQLEHRRIEALSLGEANARDLELALQQARQRRADMTFVRPSSAYLRSAFVSTFSQTGASLRWKNMLNDGVGRFIESLDGTKQNHADIRDDLDKANWQNINTVRVSGAGSTNYVLAKDDVGNWYVKAMGTDPKAMINAARNMALFNASGTFDTNLLRMNQLQTKLDEDPDESPSEKRARWANELSDMKSGSGTVGAASERSKTLKLFTQNYDERTAADLAALKAAVNTVPDTAKTRAKEAFAADSSRQVTVTQLIDGTVPPFASVTGAAEAAAGAQGVIQILQALNGYRDAVVARIRNDESLASAQRTALQTATQALTSAEARSADKAKELLDLKRQLTDNAAQLAAVGSDGSAPDSATKTARIEALNLEKGRLENLRAGKMDEQAQLLTDVQSARQLVESRQAQLLLVRQQQAAAASAVDRSIRQLITETVNDRLRAVQELESAANVVGRRSSP